MSKPAFTAEDVRMIVEERRQLALARQALAQILGMFTWNEELGHRTDAGAVVRLCVSLP
jgi:hypothetical protein